MGLSDERPIALAHVIASCGDCPIREQSRGVLPSEGNLLSRFPRRHELVPPFVPLSRTD